MTKAETRGKLLIAMQDAQEAFDDAYCAGDIPLGGLRHTLGVRTYQWAKFYVAEYEADGWRIGEES